MSIIKDVVKNGMFGLTMILVVAFVLLLKNTLDDYLTGLLYLVLQWRSLWLLFSNAWLSCASQLMLKSIVIIKIESSNLFCCFLIKTPTQTRNKFMFPAMCVNIRKNVASVHSVVVVKTCAKFMCQA